VLALMAAAVLLLGLRGCGGLLGRGMPPAEVVLRHRLRHLEDLLASPAGASLVAFERALVVVDKQLVENLIAAAIPYEGTVAGFARIALHSADVFFDDGNAFVRLDGSAWLGDRTPNEEFARVSVYGELDVVELDPEVSVLRTRLRVIAVDAKDVNTPILSTLAERLIENLGWLRIDSFEGLTYHLEIPVRLGNELRLPEISGPDVRIAAATIPLDVSVRSIRAFYDKLWVSADVAVRPDSAAPESASAGARTESRSAGSRSYGEAHSTSLHDRYAALHAELAERVSADTLLQTAIADSAEIALALREGLVTDLMTEAARRYLDRIELDIDTEGLTGSADGDLEIKTPLGKMTAGRWSVRLDFHRLRGTLRARSPSVSVTAENRVHVALPVEIESGVGAATIQFAWDPKGLANAVCREFETSERVEGRILAREYILSGDFVLSAGHEAIVAEPDFPADKFPIAVDPSEGTWQRVMETLRSQDRWNRCGIVMDPEKVVARLSALGERGFKVKLPRSIFRPVVIPASLLKSVRVGRSQVALTIRPNALRMSPGTFWYSASFATEIEGVDRGARRHGAGIP
jgi:hypothetical protein